MSYNINISIDGNGSTTPSPGTYTYNDGEIVSLSATADYCNEFIRWGGSGSDINLSDFADSGGTGNNFWRGYIFQTSESSYLTDIFAGATSDEFLWGFYKVSNPSLYDDENDPTTIDDAGIELVTNSEGQQLWGNAPDSRHASCQNYANTHADARNININAELSPNEYYIFAQGRAGSSGNHYHAENFNFQTFMDQHDIINYFGPEYTHDGYDQFGFRWYGGDQTVPTTRDSNPPTTDGTANFPDLGIELETSRAIIDDPQSSDTTMEVVDDGDVVANFQNLKYDLHISLIGEDGGTPDASVDITPGGVATGDYTEEYSCDEEVNLYANETDDSHFTYWELNGQHYSDENEIIITMDEEKEFNAVYMEGYTLDVYFDNTSSILVYDQGYHEMPVEISEDTQFTIEPGLEVRLSAGTSFKYWSGDPITTDNEEDEVIVFDMNTDKQVTGHFGEPVTLTIMREGNGEGSVDPGIGTFEYPYDSSANLTAIPDDNSKFVSWSNNVDIPDEKNTSIHLIENTTVTLDMKIKEFDLEIDHVGHGTTSPTKGIHTYQYGDNVSLSAQGAIDTSFIRWAGSDYNELNQDKLSSSNSIDMYDDYKLEAIFLEPDEYNKITITTEGEGTTTPKPGVYYLPDGYVLNITTTSHNNWFFSHWEQDIDSTDPEQNIQVNSDMNIKAVFSSREVTLDINIEGQGSTTPTEGTYTYNHGDKVDLSANPDNDWRFSHWRGRVESNESENTSIYLDRSHQEVTAVFTQKPYTLKINIEGNGHTTPGEGIHPYKEGAMAYIYAYPSSDDWSPDMDVIPSRAIFQNWEEINGALGTALDNNKTYIIMDGDKEITAHFNNLDSSNGAMLTGHLKDGMQWYLSAHDGYLYKNNS